ncbi:MAG TPA: iron chelate uptake ABC transporter family permease subunit [Thermodesulfobacteriota bacterium]|nr:iron chelate uptake ABC transporter family permease subunit [Thermodesulfobacteriota bacterium]
MELLQYEFMRNALGAAVLVSIACGIIGTYVVIKKLVFISGGISHAAFGGIGLGYLLGVNPILTTIPFSILSAISIGTITKKVEVSEDTAIGILWTVGMALGIIFINLSPGYAPDLFGYLFGSILTVPSIELAIMFILDLVIILTVLVFHKEFLAMSFDEEFSTVVGMPTKSLYLLLLCLVALSVVVLIKVVGVILVIALLTIPATIGKQFTYNVRKLIILSIAIGIVLNVVGLLLSYVLDLASGATIVLVLVAAFVVSLFLKRT